MRFALTCLIFLSALPAQAASWYIDNAAGGNGNGTSWANAWTSLTTPLASNSFINAGDTVYLSGGASAKTYYGQLNVKSGTAGNLVTYSTSTDSGHGGTVILDAAGTNTYAIWLGPEEYWRVTGGATTNLVFTNSGSLGDNQAFGGGPFSHGHIDNIAVYRMGSGMFCAGLTDFEIHNSTFIDIASVGALRLGGADDASYDQVKIHHCNFLMPANSANAYCGPDAVYCVGAGVSVYNCVFKSHVLNAGVYGANHGDGVQGTGTRAKVYNNEFHTYANGCIQWNDCDVMHDSMVYNNVFMNDTYVGAASSAFFSGENCATPLSLVSNIYWINNTFVDFPTCWGFDWENAAPEGNPVVTNFFIQNNIFVNCGTGWVIGFGKHINPNFHWEDVTCTYNLVNAGASGTTNMNVGGIGDGNYTTNQISNALLGMPTFVSYTTNSAANDLRLDAGDTAAKGQGTDKSALFTTDAFGTTRSAPWDLGYFEVTGSSPAPAGTKINITSGVVLQGVRLQ